MKYLFPFFLLHLFSCNEAADPKPDDPGGADTTVDVFSGCYRHVTGRDTILLELKQTGNGLSGTMKFDNYQMDSSEGTVEGQMKDDTAFLWYRFFSEGMQSVMEVVLKKSGDGLIRGNGPVIVSGDSSLFKTPDSLEFSTGQKLQKIECALK